MSKPAYVINLKHLELNEHWKWEVTVTKDKVVTYIAHYIGERQALSAYKTLCKKYGITPE